MNQEHNRHIDFDEVARYLAKEMEPGERASFEKLLADSSELKTEFEHIASIWTDAPNTVEFDTDAAWTSLDSRIQEQVSEETENRNPQKFSLGTALRIAASVILLVTAGWYITTFTGKDEVYSVAALETPLSQELPDNSIAELNTGSVLEYDDTFEGEQRLVKLKGEAFFKVTHNPEKPFIVETEMGNVRVLGTEFNVKQSQEGEFEITVQSGKVRVSSPDGTESKELTKGQSAILNALTGKFEVSYHTANLYWLTRSIRFNRIDYKTVFEILSRTFDVQFEVQNVNIHNCELKTTLRKDQNLDDFLKVIQQNEEGEEGGQIEFIKKGDSVYEVHGKGC